MLHCERTHIYPSIKISAGENTLRLCTREGEREIQLAIIAPGSRPARCSTTRTFYLVSGGQAAGGTRERNVYDTRGTTDVLSVLRVNCALASFARERRPVHRLLQGLRDVCARLKICERVSSSRSRYQPARCLLERVYRITSMFTQAGQSSYFDDAMSLRCGSFTGSG